MIYHALAPHPALCPIPIQADPVTLEDQTRNEAAYRQLLVQGALAVLLPTEDLENACLRTLVADVVADTILGNSVGDKVSESWFIWSSISKAIGNFKAYAKLGAKDREMEANKQGQLEEYGLLPEKRDAEELTRPRKKGRAVFSTAFWRILQYGYLFFVGLSFLIRGLWAAHHASPRSLSALHLWPVSPVPKGPNTDDGGRLRPILAFRSFALISTVVGLLQHMPWVFGACSLIQHQLLLGPLALGATDAIVDQ